MTSIDRVTHRSPGTARARAGQIAGAVVIDAAVLALPVGAAVVAAGPARAPDLAVLAALVAVGAVVGQLRNWGSTGQTWGLAVVGARQVTRSDDSPPGFARALHGTWIADVRGARDPVDPALLVPLPPPPGPQAPPVAPTARASGGEPVAPRSRARARALLVLDGRVGGAVGDGVVLGRNPTAIAGERAVAIADIGREISKAHLGVTIDDDGGAWATDRGSTNGSTLVRSDGTSIQLAPGRATPLRPGDHVRIGSHTVAVQFVTEVSVAAR